MRYNSNILNFDGANKVIHTKVDTLSLLQIYSQWKTWVMINDNAKFLPAFSYNTDRPVIINGWIIKID
jgi:hypothetical protein